MDDSESARISRLYAQQAKGDLSDFELRDLAHPGQVPIFTTCNHCGGDISNECKSFLLITQELVPGRPQLVKGVLATGEMQLGMRTQFITLMPQRCPRCQWPMWWGDPTSVRDPRTPRQGSKVLDADA